eukprot:1841795-Pleurochrysis_carterae.AAC.1
MGSRPRYCLLSGHGLKWAWSELSFSELPCIYLPGVARVGLPLFLSRPALSLPFSPSTPAPLGASPRGRDADERCVFAIAPRVRAHRSAHRHRLGRRAAAPHLVDAAAR